MQQCWGRWQHDGVNVILPSGQPFLVPARDARSAFSTSIHADWPSSGRPNMWSMKHAFHIDQKTSRKSLQSLRALSAVVPNSPSLPLSLCLPISSLSTLDMVSPTHPRQRHQRQSYGRGGSMRCCSNPCWKTGPPPCSSTDNMKRGRGVFFVF